MNEDLSQVVNSLRRMMQDRHNQQDESVLELTEVAQETIVISDHNATITESAHQEMIKNAHFGHLYAKMNEASSIYDTSRADGLDKKQDFFESFVKDTLMEWMNQHLPNMVQKLVTQEINKLSNELYAKKNSQS